MAGQCWFIADRPSAIIQPGQPSAQQAAWLLDIPDGSNALNTAAAFADAQGMPIGTIGRVIDLTKTPLTISTWKLSSQWVSQP